LTEEGLSDKRLERTAQYGASYRVVFPKYNYNDEVKEDYICRTQRAWGKKNIYRISTGKPGGKRPLG
jgi:hypothetical protein